MLYAGSRPIITIDDVKTIVSQSKSFTAFELARFVGEKNLSKSLATLQSMLQNGEEAIMMLGALASHFRRIWRIRELLDQKLPPADIGKQLKISPYFLNEQIAQAKKFTVPELDQLFRRLYLGDVSIKTGSTAQTVLHGLLYETCIPS